MDAAREEVRTRLALGMGVAYRTDKRKRREDEAPREPHTEHRGSPARSTTRSITQSITQSTTRSTKGAP